MQPHACLKSLSYYGMSSYTVQEKKRQGDLCQIGFFFGHCTLSLMPSYKWGWKEGQGRIPGTFMHTCFHLEISWASDNQIVETGFKHCHILSLPLLPAISSYSSLKSLAHSTFPQSFQQDLTRIWFWEYPGAQLASPLLWDSGCRCLGCLGALTMD